MDDLNDHDYFLRRAASATRLAGRAVNANIAAIHRDLAKRYELTARQSPREALARDWADQAG